MSAPARAASRLSPDSRRSQLIELALELFGRTPYEQVSMADVARSAGVSEALVYHYFAKKRGLFIAVLNQVLEELLRATQESATAKSPQERLIAGLDEHLRFAERYPEAYTTLLLGGAWVDREVRELCERARWVGLDEIIRSTGISPASPRMRVALRGWSGFQEGAIVEWLKRRDIERGELIEMLAVALMDALKSGGKKGWRHDVGR